MIFYDFNYFYWDSLLEIIVTFVTGVNTFFVDNFSSNPSDDVLYLVVCLVYFFSLFIITYFFIRFLVSIFKFIWRIL